MSSLNLSVLTPKGKVFEDTVSYAMVPSTKGPLGIMPGHTTLIAPLASEGILKIIKTNKEEIYFVVSFGALEVKKEKTIVLAETAIKASSKEDAEIKLNELKKAK